MPRKRWPHVDHDGEPWHAPTCELYEVNESDCAYQVDLCTCGFVERPEHDAIEL